MLRLLTLVLLLANLLVWAWHSPALAQWLGLNLAGQREPQRLEQQFNADKIALLPPGSATATATATTTAAVTPPAATVAPSCLEAGPLGEDAFKQAGQLLQQAGLGGSAWSDERSESPGAWLVYMGRFANPQQLQHKQDELGKLGIAHEPAGNEAPELTPGLVLGRHASEAAARAQLAQLATRRVRTARVVMLRPARVEHRLRVPGVDPASAERLRAAAPAAVAWRECATAAPPP